MDASLVVNAAIGALMPIAISYFKNAKWPTPLKTLFSLVLCAVVALAAEAIMGNLDDIQRVSQGVLVVISSALTLYGAWFKGTEFNARLTGGSDA